MSNPIYATIIPPTIRTTSKEIPKMLNALSPMSAEAIKTMRMESATLMATNRFCVDANFDVSLEKMVPHMTGLMTAKTVTVACTILCRLVSTLGSRCIGIAREA
jgi:hypothetical protein